MYAPLDAGKLDKQVVIQANVRTDDGGGGANINYVDTGTAWASIEPGSGREFFEAKQLNPELSHVVKIRYRASVTPNHRLRYVSQSVDRVFAIHSVSDPLERHEQLVLLCSEQTIT
jgi:SPP1 family predicted phage head-tail adaptor